VHFMLIKITPQEIYALTKICKTDIIHGTTSRSKSMPAAYEIGQIVLVKLVSDQNQSTRITALQPYTGQTGVISDYYWIEPPTGKVFYLYTVRIKEKEIVLYEDEIEPA
jgi:hypothetical protein